MNVSSLNKLLFEGVIDQEGMWPRIVEYESKAAAFQFEFGLDSLPIIPGIIVIRGPRQYGKSTWLDINLRSTIRDFGKGTAFYLNGDDLSTSDELEKSIRELIPLFDRKARVKRLFIDEITAISGWEKSIKKLWDQGDLKDILIITTGSKALDLRRGSEKLPGRKGKLDKTEFIFLPISYKQFYAKCGKHFGDKAWMAYLITGGSPVLCNDIYQFDRLSESSIQMIRDWILGDILSTGRSRVFFYNLLAALYRFAPSPVGYAKLARESGLSNNTVASGYVDQLSDLLALLPSWQWDATRNIPLANKPCKFHFINLAVALSFHKSSIRYLNEFEELPSEEKGIWLEWLVAQELWRRTILEKSIESAERMSFWKSEKHEIDFVTSDGEFIEVKWGKAGPLDFSWFPKVFPKKRLHVICQNPFETEYIRGITPHQFLLHGLNVPFTR